MKKTTTIMLVCSLTLLSQDITNKLGALGNYDITDSNGHLLMRLQSDAGVYFSSPYAGTGGTIPMEGIGTRMIWHPNKSAFRAGFVDGTQWNEVNIGSYSIGLGRNTTASGLNAVSIGYSNSAEGNYSTALGHSTKSSGEQSTALNYYTNASGQASLASGYLTDATGAISTAMGYNTTASGNSAIAMGNSTIASGDNSTAMGSTTTASGDYSTAMGYGVQTANSTGSFIIGDYQLGRTTSSSTNNEMTMRFAGGYRFFTDIYGSIGASLAGMANSWSTISDSTKKENFQQTDGEYFLNSIKELKLGSWNYKAQDSSIRHYGPMAQEIFKYFGKDDFGIIGNDTTLATADMDGIMMIAIQALEKRTKELQLEKDKEIASLKSEIKELKQLIGSVQ